MEHTKEVEWDDLTGGYFEYLSQEKIDILKYAPKDIKEMILLKLDHLNLKEACQISKDIKAICDSEEFQSRYFQKWGKISLDEIVNSSIQKLKKLGVGPFRKATNEDVNVGDSLDMTENFSEDIEEYGDLNYEKSVYTDGKDNWIISNMGIKLIFKPEKDGMRFGIDFAQGLYIDQMVITLEGEVGLISEYDIEMPPKYRRILKHAVHRLPYRKLDKWDYKEAVKYFKMLIQKLTKN